MMDGGDSNFIGGKWVGDAAGEVKAVHSPIDGSEIGR